MKHFLQIIGVIAALLCSGSVLAQEDSLQVATIERHPFVIVQDGELTGFSIELWQEIATENNWKYEFLLQEKFTDLLAAPRIDTADLSIANISITADREEVLDFSSPIYDGGMLIMVSESYSQGVVAHTVLDKGFWQLIALITALFFICGLWLKSRRTSLNIDRSDIKHVLKDLLVLRGVTRCIKDKHPTRIIFLTWLAGLGIGLVMAAVSITTSVITYQYQTDIKTIEDLRGLTVGAIGGSTSEAYLQQEGIDTITYSNIENLFSAVADGRLVATVHDAPVINHYVSNNPSQDVYIAGRLFNPEKYGIAFASGSPLVEQTNQTILRLRENGRYQELYDSWFAN